MYDWTALDQAVRAALADGRVGTPVFVRWTASAAAEKQDIKALLAEMSAYAGRWLADSPRQLYAAGGAAQGHISLALNYAHGGSALLAAALAHGRPYNDLAVFGANGALYHSDSAPAAAERPAPLQIEAIQGPSAGLAVEDALAAIDRSLASNQPVQLSARGSLR